MSGIQPTGVIHLGNYLGAVRNWKRLQNEHNELFFSVVDLHSLTTVEPRLPGEGDEIDGLVHTNLRWQTRQMMAALLACGIDAEKAVLFPQSMVSGHAELAWILSCITPTSWLTNMIQYKEKKSQRQVAGHGLLTYPVLMAADILLYRATHVPVGVDQEQHIELTRDIARRFNWSFCNPDRPLFPEPQSLYTACPKVMSLRDGTRKMSKSEISDMSRINLTDDADTIARKVRKAKTDSVSHITYDPDVRPELANLLRMHASLTESSPEEIVTSFQGKNTLDLKLKLTDVLVAHLGPIREEIHALTTGNRADQLDAVIETGVNKARARAAATLADVRTHIDMI